MRGSVVRPRWSLRILLIALIVAAFGLAGWRHATREARIIAKIESVGGFAVPDTTDLERSLLGGLTPRWAGSIDDIGLFPELDRLKSLAVVRDDLSNREIEYVANCLHLKSLRIGGRSRTVDGDLPKLAALRNLEFLSLVQWRVDGARLEWMGRLPLLKRISMRAVEPSSSEFLACLPPTIEILELEECAIDDQSLRHLSRYPRLRELRLDCASITDAGLRGVVECASLEYLSLQDTQATDACVDGLARMPRLGGVSFGARTRVTRAKAKLLAKKCQVWLGEAVEADDME